MIRGRGGEEEAEIDRLPIDILAHILFLFTSFRDSVQASAVCRKWKRAADHSLAWRDSLSFSGLKMDDHSTARLILRAYNLTDLDISRRRWGCQISDNGLFMISSAKCITNLTSISLWGMTGITDQGVVHLISKATSLRHLNIGGTFITDESIIAIANSCPHLQSIGLWSCRHVTESGLLVLVSKCGKLESINVWGTRVPVESFVGLLAISPALVIKPKELLSNIQMAPIWNVV
ncbi:F-box protein At5g67140-like [Impatiens glandulifera]|uniref:F-box protein At5g67140-like n=1 Tax=Impatiens glandulifera TaxID=253017 RepID=UPI001FB15907|nr:F-box protein At5g67140-like [Impatiens glandulifera]